MEYTEYNVDMKKEMLVTTHTSFRRLMELGSDAMALYMFYLYTSNNQDNQQVWASVRYVAEGIGWSKERVSKNNKLLKDAGWVEEIINRGEDGKVKGWYVKVNYRVTTGRIKTVPNHILENQTLVKPDTGVLGQNAPLRSKIQHKEENTPLVREENFDTFWKLFPSRRKADKTKCREKWKKFPLLLQEEILNDLPKRVRGVDWVKNSGQYIPAPLSYLNGEKWMSEIIPAPELILPKEKKLSGNPELDSF